MKSKYAVAIGREFGSGGKEIGSIAASLLGVKFFDKEIIEIASKESGLSLEHFERADEKKSFSLKSGMVGLRSSFLDDVASESNLGSENLFNIQSKVMRSLVSDTAAVIVGRCADYVLDGYVPVLSVFVTASPEERIERVRRRSGLSRSEAEEMTEKMDKTRSSYYFYFTGKQWGEKESYDIVLDSSFFGIEGCARIIEKIVNDIWRPDIT
jgi:cytidylate kinase